MEGQVVVKDALGERLKTQYEVPMRQTLTPNETVIVRLDGRAFHTYTRGLNKPFDAQLTEDLVFTAEQVARQVSACTLAYTQSDEISLVLRPTEQLWFGGDTQKIASVTASLATVVFNARRTDARLATFDSRCFTVPEHDEVLNYLIWRQHDAIRNSVSAAAQAVFSHRELQGQGTASLLDLLRINGTPWTDHNLVHRFGTLLRPEQVTEDLEYTDKRTGQVVLAKDVLRTHWRAGAAPRFEDSRAELTKWIWS